MGVGVGVGVGGLARWERMADMLMLSETDEPAGQLFADRGK